MRPQRVPSDHFELAEVTSRVDRQASFILKNTQTERFLMLSEPERFLWDQMDGRASVQDIATAYVLRYGQFDFDMIPGLIKKLHRPHLLSLTPPSRLRYALPRHPKRPLLRPAEAPLPAPDPSNIPTRPSHPSFTGPI